MPDPAISEESPSRQEFQTMKKEWQALLEDAKQAIVSCDADKAEAAARKALDMGVDSYTVITEGFVPGVAEVGDQFDRGTMFMPELILAGEAMKAGTAICLAEVPEADRKAAKKVVIGTVEGDIHDIGKSIVVSFLIGNGFDVYDLGSDVSSDKFVEKVIELNADVLGLSALLTTTMTAQKEVVEAIKKAGLEGKVKTIVGGAPTSQGWADRIGADAYAENAVAAVMKINQLTGQD